MGVSEGDQLPPMLLDDVRRYVGLDVVDLSDPLHRRVVDAIVRCGRGAPYGQVITALRFEFAWELKDAGKAYGDAKGTFEGTRSKRVFEITQKAELEGRKVSLGLAEHMADAELYELKLTYLVAEQRERAMRNFLQALDKALENHRTDRADARAADVGHRQGYGGGA